MTNEKKKKKRKAEKRKKRKRETKIKKLFSHILILTFILLHEKCLQFDWLRAVVFQLNLKYLHVKITNLLRVVV